MQTVNERIEWAKNNPSFCPFPYNTTDVRRHSSNPAKMDIICCCNVDTNKFTISHIDDPFKEIKSSMEQGYLPAACWRCKNEELQGGQSERIRSIIALNANEFPFDYNRNTELRIKFSNFCSLSCRSCSTYDSTTFAKITNNTDSDFLSQDITEIDEYWNFITTNIINKVNDCKFFHLFLIGGETLIQPGALKLLKWCIDQGLAPRIGIKLSTALSVNLSEELLNYFLQFKSIWFGMSIDSVGDNYQYVRWPVKFSKIENNLTRMLEFKKSFLSIDSRRQFDFSLDPVFSLNNIFYIKEYLDYWYGWFNANESITFLNTTLVERTNFLDIQALPVRYRNGLKAILKECSAHPIFDRYLDKTRVMQGFISATINELDVWDDNDDLWNFYLNFTAEFDIRTNTQFSILNSKLYSLLTDDDKSNFNNKLANVNISKPVSLYFNR